MPDDQLMFNEEQKNAYIEQKLETTTLNKYFLPNAFRQSCPFESELGKDLSNFTATEIENMYKTMNFASLSSLVVINNAYSLYAGWCLSALHNVEDSQNHFLEFSTETLKGLINCLDRDKKVISRATLLSQISVLKNPSDKFLMLALFEGIKGRDYEEIWTLKENDVDAVRCTMNTKRGVKKYSPELCRYARESSIETVYHSFREKSDDSWDYGRDIPFYESNLVVKQYVNIHDENPSNYRQGRRIYSKYVRILKFLGLTAMLPNDIYNSGLIHYINTKAKELGISGEEFVRTHSVELSYYYEKKITKAFLDQYGDYLV